MKPAQQPECVTESMWQSTPYTNLIRYKPSNIYFARFRLKGKLIRRSLKTTTLSVAKLRLADMAKAEQQKVESVATVASGKMTFGDALAVFQSRMQASPALKPRTKEYCDYCISALLKSWLGLSDKDVSRITGTECHDWSIKSASRNSSSSHNYTVSILKRVFAVAIEAGARYDNLATGAQRVRQRTSKQIVLPGFEKFAGLVETVRTSGSGFAKPASELVQFLAYGGFRISESRHVTREDCNFARGEIIVRGDPLTGTKNSETRIIPMIPDMRRLLEKMKAERPEDKPATPVMRVWECQKSMDRRAKFVDVRRPA